MPACPWRRVCLPRGLGNPSVCVCARVEGGARTWGLEKLRPRALGGDQALSRGFLGPVEVEDRPSPAAPAPSTETPPSPGKQGCHQAARRARAHLCG